MLALCALFGFYLLVEIADNFGLGSRPWFGWWDGGSSAASVPYVMTLSQEAPGGAMDRAGLRDGDRVDLRELDLGARVFLMNSAPATETLTIRAHRGARAVTVRFTGSIWSEGEWPYKIIAIVVPILTGIWCLVCASIISSRRSWSFEGRVLATALIAVGLAGSNVLLPDPITSTIVWAIDSAFWFTAPALLVVLSSRFGARSKWRDALAVAALAAIAAAALATCVGYVDTITLWFDPMPLWWYNSPLSRTTPFIIALVVLIAGAAVATTPRTERPRAAWLLLPLPVSLAAYQAALALQPFAPSFASLTALAILAAAFALAGAVAVTYAVVKRRVLDTGFVVSRTIVVGIVSLIVIAAFVLLEWLLGSAVSNASHATGVIANAALALTIGLSLRFIHRRVDAAVDAVLFRKRYENERAIRSFAKEAGFITRSGALLDRTIENVRRHTDARSAAILLEDDGSYNDARSFGDRQATVDENDSIILALKAWHRPLDPHQFESGLRGDLALPMVARGRLLGVIVCGERESGEAYAPDEVEALAEVARGVGAALDGLGDRSAHDGSVAAAINALGEKVDGLRASIERRVLPS